MNLMILDKNNDNLEILDGYEGVIAQLFESLYPLLKLSFHIKIKLLKRTSLKIEENQEGNFTSNLLNKNFKDVNCLQLYSNLITISSLFLWNITNFPNFCPVIIIKKKKKFF